MCGPSAPPPGSRARAARGAFRRACGAAALALSPVPAALPAAAQDIPEPVGFINDFADVIPAEAEARIQSIIDEVRAKSGGEIVVVTLESLEGRSAEQVARGIGDDWGVGAQGEIGDERRRTGVVVLVVPRESSPDGRGHFFIATARGANAFITAAEAGRIRDRLAIPEFRRQDYGQGIFLTVGALALEYAEAFDFELTGEIPELRQAARERTGGVSIGTILMIAFILFVVLSIVRRGGGGPGGRRRRSPIVFLPVPMGGRHRGGWGGFGGGGGGFGGGGFGGGGAGGSW